MEIPGAILYATGRITSLLTNPSTPRWLTLGRGRLLQQQRGSSANNHNPRRPICRPAPLFRLPPPPPPQLMMIALARSRYLFWPLFYPFDPLFWHNSPSAGVNSDSENGATKIGVGRERERKMDGGRGRVYCWRDLLRSAVSRGAQSIRHPYSAPVRARYRPPRSVTSV